MYEFPFEELHIPIPAFVKEYSYEKQAEIYNYLKTMDEKHKKAYCIAYEHLGTSFHVYHSNGFKDWLKNKLG